MEMLANHYSDFLDVSNLEIEYSAWKRFVCFNLGNVGSEELLFGVFVTLCSQIDEFPTISKLLKKSQ